MKTSKILYLLIIPLLSYICSSCKKFVQIEPPDTQISSSTVFNNNQTATSAISGIYSSMMSSSGFISGGPFSLNVLCGFSADELINYSGVADPVAYYTNSLNSTTGDYNWAEAYKYIYDVNIMLEKITSSSGVSADVKKQLEGEAKFIRAFCYFYLTNIYGDVPLITSSDYQENMQAKRDSSEAIYQQVITDLNDAQQLLAPDYSFSNGERVRPNKWAATALLARVYLFHSDWENAENEAAVVINSGNFKLMTNLDSVFLADNPEAIWQLRPVIPGQNTNEAATFILLGHPTIASISPYLLSSFEKNDQRRLHWVSYIVNDKDTFYYPFKYKVYNSQTLTEYSTVLRLAEQYLIRSEARAEQNNITGAEEDLNIIRHRAGLPNITTSDKDSLLSAILHERQVELFSEYGNRWFDLKRTAKIDAVMQSVSPQKGGTWSSYKSLFPIPQSEILNDPNLTQNNGYQ